MAVETPFILSDEHHYALDQIDHLKGCLFITGKAGTGKSTLIQLFRKLSEKKVIFLAPTGVAAVQIKGQTIHSFFKFPPSWISKQDYKLIPKNLLDKIDLIFIDEISMVRADILDHIDQLLRQSAMLDEPFGGKAMLWTGDLFQLPPVVCTAYEKEYFSTKYASPYFFSATVFKQLKNFELIELGQVFRQSNPMFIKLLEKIRMNTIDEEELLEINTTCFHNQFIEQDHLILTLTSTNQSANFINTNRLNQLSTESKIYTAHITGQVLANQYPVEEHMVLKEGAQIMLVRNDPNKRFVNGSLGVVIKLNDKTIQILLENESKPLEIERFVWEIIRYKMSSGKNAELKTEVIGTFSQFPVRLAWAITIHKSQGKTFEKIIIDFGRGAFEHGQAYVALSRCKSLEGIVLKQALSWKDIRTDERVIDFLRKYQ
ncbi:MAG: DEAD/DEAH box helicase [Saprospiraceae bacterium]